LYAPIGTIPGRLPSAYRKQSFSAAGDTTRRIPLLENGSFKINHSTPLLQIFTPLFQPQTRERQHDTLSGASV